MKLATPPTTKSSESETTTAYLAAPPPRQSPWVVVLRSAISLSAIAAAVTLVAVLRRPDAGRRPPQAGPSQSVEAVPAAAHSGAFEFEVDGIVEPFREVVMAAEVAGRIQYKSPDCQEGRAVEQGELLFRIDARDYELELEQAQGTLDELAAQMKSAQLLTELAEEDHKLALRERDRFEQAPDQSVFSRSEIDTARRNELAARNALQSRRDELLLLSARQRRIQGALQLAALNKSRCEVRSPISGVIVREEVEQDGFVQKGGLLLAIRDTSKMDVRCSLRMRQLQWLWQAARGGRSASENSTGADPTAVAVINDSAGDDSDGGETTSSASRQQQAYQFPVTRATVIYELNAIPFAWRGNLVRYADSGLDPQTRLVPCVVEVDAPHQAVRLDDSTRSPAAPPTLLSGMYVKVRIHTRLAAALLQAPPEAVGPDGQMWIVEQGRLRRVRATVVHADSSRVLVEESPRLRAGAQVVVSPLASPVEGGVVNVVQLEPGADEP